MTFFFSRSTWSDQPCKRLSPGGRAEPVLGHATGGRRGTPAPKRRSGSHDNRLFTCKGDIHATSEPC
jgi:hypothetical protein